MSGNDCSLVVKGERKDSFTQMCQNVSGKRKDGKEDSVAKTERDTERRKKMAGFLVVPRPAKSLQNGAGLIRKT